jgi:hypothetical protein
MRQKEPTLQRAADRIGIDVKTARKYLQTRSLPSQIQPERYWQTRQNPFEDEWSWVVKQLDQNPGLQAKTLFAALQREYPGKYQDGQLRTLQRHIKHWRATAGPPREVFFSQVHYPGILSQSDFTSMNALGITINGEPFDHLLYHFVLTYANWETFTICFSESFESLQNGLQNALWELGGVPQSHQTDRLSAAVSNNCNPAEFTQKYTDLMNHYGLEGRKIQSGKANENGDVEQRHYRFRELVDQSLMLRGSKDFRSREEYNTFLRRLCDQANAGRTERFAEEQSVLGKLPHRRIDDFTKLIVRVTGNSTIRVKKNTYSVPSQFRSEQVTVRLYADYLEVWYGQQKHLTLDRLRGSGKHHINYRHIIDSLVRKPGAFKNYRYRADMFPTTAFRIAYDLLRKTHPASADKQYLKILNLAAKESQSKVASGIQTLLRQDVNISFEVLEAMVLSEQMPACPLDQDYVAAVDITTYDQLLSDNTRQVPNE